MESNGFHGGLLFSGFGSGMLGLEMPLHQQQQNPQNPQNPIHLNHHPQMVAFAHHPETDQHHHAQSLQSVKQQSAYSYAPKAKQQMSPLSDEDELGFAPDDADGKRKVSPWQRMKWTDSMVRLLIMAVFYIGDEVGSEGVDKKKVGVLLQKKGKWKSVSRAMMEKGFYVSPQQCEDKFNDLNKRYKRVNEILGKGTACRVVENQNLLDGMDLSPKMKEEVKKLLNSKHLFFREMCAYHNSCGHGSTTGTGANHSSDVAAEPSHVPLQQAPQQRCSHSPDNINSAAKIEAERSKMGRAISEEDDDGDGDEDESDDEDDDFDDDEGHSRGHNDEDDNHNGERPHKRPRKDIFATSLSPVMQQFSSEVSAITQDVTKSSWEKKHYLKMKLLQLEEQHVNYQCQAFELEKQRLKWVKFSSKKEREMERAKLENDRKRLENERMLLVIKQKEIELIDLHHHQQQHSSNNKRSDPSSITG